MNEQLTTSIIELVDFAKVGIIRGISILQAEMPELISQILAYGFWHSIWIISFTIVITIILISFIRIGLKEKFENAVTGICIAGTSGIAIISWIKCFVAINNLILIYVAPKLYIIQYVQTFLRP